LYSVSNSDALDGLWPQLVAGYNFATTIEIPRRRLVVYIELIVGL